MNSKPRPSHYLFFSSSGSSPSLSLRTDVFSFEVILFSLAFALINGAIRDAKHSLKRNFEQFWPDLTLSSNKELKKSPFEHLPKITACWMAKERSFVFLSLFLLMLSIGDQLVTSMTSPDFGGCHVVQSRLETSHQWRQTGWDLSETRPTFSRAFQSSYLTSGEHLSLATLLIRRAAQWVSVKSVVTLTKATSTLNPGLLPSCWRDRLMFLGRRRLCNHHRRRLHSRGPLK